jgi:hypothetical protein
MARSERKRQQAIQRKNTKRKHKQQVVRQQSAPRSRRAIAHAAAKWPLYECLMTKNWTDVDEIVQILVARRQEDGPIVVASFLVDLGCLGVKDAALASFETAVEYREEYRDILTGSQPMAKADLNLVAKVIREAVAYAHTLGFDPPRDFREAQILLRDADPDACPTPVPLGRDGKPYFVAGPYDDPLLIFDKLTKAVGPENFHYVVPIPLAVLPDELLEEVGVLEDPSLDDDEYLDELEEGDDWDEDDPEDEDEEVGDRPRDVPSPISVIARLADRLKRPRL